jgi:hypothetical protein
MFSRSEIPYWCQLDYSWTFELIIWKVIALLDVSSLELVDLYWYPWRSHHCLFSGFGWHNGWTIGSMIEIRLLKVFGLTWSYESLWLMYFCQTFLSSVLALVHVVDSCPSKLHVWCQEMSSFIIIGRVWLVKVLIIIWAATLYVFIWRIIHACSI